VAAKRLIDRLRTAWEVVCCIAWAFFHMGDAELPPNVFRELNRRGS